MNSSWSCWSYSCGLWMLFISGPGMRNYRFPVRRSLDVGPRGNSHIALAPCGPQPTNNQWTGVGFHAVRGDIHPRNDRVRPWVVGVLHDMHMEEFLVQGWKNIVPGCGGTSTLAREEILATRWLYYPQPISDQPLGVGLPHTCGGRHRPKEPLFSFAGLLKLLMYPWYCGVCGPGMGPYRSRRSGTST